MVFEQDVASIQRTEYHKRRADQELALARRAKDAGARKVHSELAERHAALMAESSSNLQIVRDQ